MLTASDTPTWRDRRRSKHSASPNRAEACTTEQLLLHGPQGVPAHLTSVRRGERRSRSHATTAYEEGRCVVSQKDLMVHGVAAALFFAAMAAGGMSPALLVLCFYAGVTIRRMT